MTQFRALFYTILTATMTHPKLSHSANKAAHNKLDLRKLLSASSIKQFRIRYRCHSEEAPTKASDQVKLCTS